jgi:hypothetical protein
VIRITPGAMGHAIAGLLANPSVSAATIMPGGQFLIERIDGRLLPGAAVPRGEVERIIAGLAKSLGRPPGDRQPIVAEDPAADLVATAFPPGGIVAPSVCFARIAPPRLRGWVAAGLLGGGGAARLAGLLRDGANLVVAACSEPARRQIVRTLLAEATAFGQRVVHVQEHERFHIGSPGFLAIAVPTAGAACRDGIEAAVDRLRPCRLVFSAPTVVAQPWLLDQAIGRRRPCIMSMDADGPRRAFEQLDLLIGKARRDGTVLQGKELIDAVVATAAPGAVWQLVEVGGG